MLHSFCQKLLILHLFLFNFFLIIVLHFYTCFLIYSILLIWHWISHQDTVFISYSIYVHLLLESSFSSCDHSTLPRAHPHHKPLKLLVFKSHFPFSKNVMCSLTHHYSQPGAAYIILYLPLV